MSGAGAKDTGAGRQPGHAELLEGAIRTLEDVLMPELHTRWARASAIGLAGQLRYALGRMARDSLAEQDAALEACLASLLGSHAELREALSDAELRGERSWDLRARAARLLSFAQGRDGSAADAVRAELRGLLVDHARQDLGESGPLLAAFLAADSLGSQG